MSRLKDLPLDSLKVPKPFIDGIVEDESDYAVARGIVDLGHRLNLDLVAEGIETAEQLDRVRAMGCELAQGHYLARPAAATDTVHHVTRQRGLTRPDARPSWLLEVVVA